MRILPFFQVMFTMPMAPLVVNKTSGDWMWTAASVLPLRTPKLEFGAPFEEESTEGLSYLERFVDRLLQRSFQVRTVANAI